MRLATLTLLVMVAFAANSLLNRAALGGDHIDSLSFALIRVASGALVLALWVRARPTRASIAPAAALTLYLVALSLAYTSIDAGIGALILFAAVQITMMGLSALASRHLPMRQLLGGLIALGGLAFLLLPGAGAVPSLLHSVIMALSGVGWGLYSLMGRGSETPTRDTAANFALATPMVALCVLPVWARSGVAAMPDATGIALAIASGAISSAMGYALWYAILPALGAARAAVVQLSVPVIVLIGGFVLLGETLGSLAILASGATLFGIAVATLRFDSPRFGSSRT